MDLGAFKNDCMYKSSDIVVQKCLIDGISFFFNTLDEGEEFSFKKDIATILNVHIRDIVIIGSGKLGFSLKPSDPPEQGLYLYKKFDHDYEQDSNNLKSDLDIAIVSSNLFDKEIENLYNHFGFYKKSTWKDRNSFAQYALKGRFVIDFLPSDFILTKGIKEVQTRYKKLYERDINMEIYKSWYFFETYHQENIKNIQLNLIR